MAKNTKGDGSKEPNIVTVVTPDNIGAGIQWNPNTNKFDVKIAQKQPIVINDNGELEVRVSKLDGNQLRLMKDGLYYGNKASDELANLYVDAVNGIDQDPFKVQGAGTRAKPLKTVAYALSIGEVGTQRYVYLMENQDHIFDATQNLTTYSGTINLNPYGSRTDEHIRTSPERTTAVLRLVSENKAPRIVFTGLRTWANNDNTNGGYLYTCLHAKGTIVNFVGLELINDLSFTLNPIHGMGGDKLSIKQAARLQCSENAEFWVNFCKIKSRGTTVSNVGEAFIKAGKINRCGFFHGTLGAISLYTILNDLSQDCTCAILAEHGWNAAASANTKLNIRALSESNLRYVGKATFDTLFDTIAGAKFLRVPVVDVKTEYFL